MKNLLIWFLNTSRRTRGFILIVSGLVLCFLSILFTSHRYGNNFIENIQDSNFAEIKIGKVWIPPASSYYTSSDNFHYHPLSIGREGHWVPKHTFRIPLKLVFSIGLIPIITGIAVLYMGIGEKDKKTWKDKNKSLQT
jgi:hypothetical protein